MARWMLSSFLLLGVVVGASMLVSPTVALNESAQIVPGAPASTEPRPYALNPTKWTDRTTVAVYSNWDGGTCVLDGADLSGAASNFVAPASAQTTLEASLADIDARLGGGLVLAYAGPASRAQLCGTSSTQAVVIGWGHIPETGRTVSYSTPGLIGRSASGLSATRIFLNNAYDFSCSGDAPLRDLQHTMTHELLHAIGVGHSQDQGAIMAAVSTACQSSYLLTTDDTGALAALYPPRTPAASVATVAPPSTEFQSMTSTPSQHTSFAVFRGGSVDAFI
jgi:hypothetical protein